MMKNNSVAKWRYIFATVTILSVSIIIASFAPAISQNRSASYMIASEQATYAWRVNVSDGSISYCQRDSAFNTNPDNVKRQVPVCSSSSGPASH